MPLNPAVGATYAISVPNATELIALGYTHIRVYWATSEGGSYSLETSILLVAGTGTYSYNHTTGESTDWAQHSYYGATPGETARTEPVQIGGPQSTRLAIREGVGRRLRIMDGPFAITTVTDADTIVISDLIDPDASASRYCNRFARCVSGTAIGQTRRTRTESSTPAGYVPSTGTVNVGRATSPAWVANDELEIWRPKGDDDPSVLIDEAMQRARFRLWWEETVYLVTGENQTEYLLPSFIRAEGQVKSVDYCADTYPEQPRWSPVTRWDVTKEAQQSILTVEAGGVERQSYGTGTLLRVRVNRFGDRMDSDTDTWTVDLEWAVAQVAVSFLETLGSPSGGFEDIIDVQRALEIANMDLATFRAILMPGGGVLEVLPG